MTVLASYWKFESAHIPCHGNIYLILQEEQTLEAVIGFKRLVSRSWSH